MRRYKRERNVYKECFAVKLSEIYQIADALAPKSLSDEYCAKFGAYDNSGVLVDAGEDIKGVLFSLDLSLAAIDEAIKTGANLIITHHPAIYGKISDIRVDDGTFLGEKLVRCLRNGISVIAMQLNLDCAKGGTDESLAQGVMLAGKSGSSETALMHALSCGGYGRAYDLSGVALGELAKGLEKELHTNRVTVYGATDRKIYRAASFCGAGVDEEAIAFARAQGADVIVSSDFKHHLLTLANESGLAVIVLTHYASENYGFEKYYLEIRRQINVPCVYHTDGEML